MIRSGRLKSWAIASALVSASGGCPPHAALENVGVSGGGNGEQRAPSNGGADGGGEVENGLVGEVGGARDGGGSTGMGGAANGGGFEISGPAVLGDPVAARIFFSDLTSGPASGGYNGGGAIVTLYGNGFGEQRGDSSVTVGGVAAADYLLWSDARIAVQLGADARTGEIVVHSPSGASNGVPFTVRDGRIFCVAVNGDDGASGAFDQPWASLPHAVESVGPGDIIYAMNGVSAVSEHLSEAALSLESDGMPDAPIALLAFPGATVTVGDPGALHYGVRVAPPVGVHTSYWVIAGLRIRGRISALDIGGDGAVGWRVVGNDISCPNGDGPTGCFVASMVTEMRFLGNEVHDTGVVGASKQYHAAYFTTDSNHVEVAWNHVHDNNTCRAIQFHSSPLCLPDCGPGDTTGFNQYDLIVHDNLIHGDACDGIVFATVDPSQGPVEAYNNVIYDVGRGPDPSDGGASYAGIFLPGYVNNGPEGTGFVEVYNNTFYDCGARGGSAAGALARGEYSPGLVLRLRNNIIHQPAGQPYLSEESHADLVAGDHNLWFGNGPGPAFLAANVDADPRFVDLANRDFRLGEDSPAIDAGVDVGLSWDIIGAGRSAGSAIDLGALEH
ncbi:MAG: IPT/TIG domain-containing protein [Phycisphaerae bacterium]|jgi:hypothetical protein